MSNPYGGGNTPPPPQTSVPSPPGDRDVTTSTTTVQQSFRASEPNGELAFTGGEVGLFLLIAALLLAFGALFVAISRRGWFGQR